MCLQLVIVVATVHRHMHRYIYTELDKRGANAAQLLQLQRCNERARAKLLAKQATRTTSSR
jgi:hypothetical protein